MSYMYCKQFINLVFVDNLPDSLEVSSINQSISQSIRIFIVV